MKSDSLRLGLLDAGLDMDLEDRMAAHELTVREAKCGVYFAPSNIPNAGFGTYTAVPLAGKGLVVVSSCDVLRLMTLFSLTVAKGDKNVRRAGPLEA